MNKQANHIGESNEMVTAVEWLEAKLSTLDDWCFIEEWTIEAKAIEKEQIINALGVGCQIKPKGLMGYYEMGEQYYEEKYGK